MQTDAAARTGFSVSAIRKWRRMGLVADRKITSANGLERVEVRLEDVLARTASQPERRPPEPGTAEAHTPPGCIVITIEDLEALFDRMVRAERRAEEAEAAAEALHAQATFTFGQIAELRRQLGDGKENPAEPTAPVPAAEPRAPSWEAAPGPTGSTAPPRPAPRPAPVDACLPRPRRVPEPAPPRDPFESNGVGPPPRSRVEELGDELRRIYARLDAYRGEAVITPEAQQRHQRDLAEYDRTLVTVCEAMRIPTGLVSGEPVGVEARAALTRALARAGLDVRAGVASTRGPRRPRIPARRRL